MRRYCTLLLPILLCLAGAPVFAQTIIGGGTCASSTIVGTYEILLSGRQTTAAGTISRIFQGVGTASFDGLSKVTLTLTANTVTTSQVFGTPLVYSGTYSLQANCIGTINITTGDTATFTLEVHAIDSTTLVAGAFAVIGSDASYAYNGTGNLQPATCPTTLSGIHEFNTTGNSLSGTSVTGVLDAAGVLNFNGQGGVTANWSQVSNLTATTVSATGTYSINSTCQASATVTDTAKNTYTFTLSLNSASPAFALAIATAQAISDGSGAATQVSTTTGCSAAMLTGTYYMVLTGRVTTSGALSKLLASNGAATFDGQSKVTFNLTSNAVNGSQAFGTAVTYSGTYSVQSSCLGTINLTSGDTATMQLVAYSINATTGRANAFAMVGTDATYALTGGGSAQPAACATSTLSGTWSFSGTANSLAGSSITGVVDLAGTLQFDGQGAVSGNWTEASNTGQTSVSASGTYTVTGACVGTLTLSDTASNKYASTVSIYGVDAADFEWVMTDPQILFSGNGRSAFVNPGESVDNAASFNFNQTPAGSVFSIFGSNLATKSDAPNLPLPTLALTTSVTVNGELCPLFYVSPTQINAQMPEDVKAGLATVIVKNGSSTSNAVAVTIPATGTPGIVVYGVNRAVVVNSDNVTVNSPTAPAKVGDEVTVYFTGGGPVNAAGPLTTGGLSPNGLSPLSEPYTVTLSGTAATVEYIGLTPQGIGLYQANFVVPKVATGDHPLVITISGQASNNPVIAVTAN
jgi:uncharacterized protein (TIGR03437 family)